MSLCYILLLDIFANLTIAAPLFSEEKMRGKRGNAYFERNASALKLRHVSNARVDKSLSSPNHTLMDEPRKYILDRFQEHLRTSFEGFCARHALEPTEGQFVSFLIDQGLIPRTNLQRFTVLREFEKINAVEEYPKSQMVGELSDRFAISQRTVWSILKHHRRPKTVGS